MKLLPGRVYHLPASIQDVGLENFKIIWQMIMSVCKCSTEKQTWNWHSFPFHQRERNTKKPLPSRVRKKSTLLQYDEKHSTHLPANCDHTL